MKLQEGTVYEIWVRFEGDAERIQRRYVFAQTEEEATAKFEAYNEQQVGKGFARMIAVGEPMVDNGFVIA